MRFAVFLFLLLWLIAAAIAHPWGNLSYRHHRQRRAEEDTLADQAESDKECFFAKERKTTYVKLRPSYSQVSEKCGVKMKRISELLDVNYKDLFQSPNYPALILFRGAGMIDIDWNNKQEIEELGKKWICSTHEAELGWNWHSTYPHRHFRQQERAKEPHHSTRKPDYVCSMQPPFFQHEEKEVLHNEVHFIEADEARAILKLTGNLIHPGLLTDHQCISAVCAEHNELARRILAQEKVESRGYNIRPSPVNGDFSQAPVISRDVNDLSDTRAENDPDYFPHHREIPPRKDFLPPPNFRPEVKTAYAAFMEALGLDSSMATKNWNELDERSKRRKVEGLSIASDAMAHLMAPADPLALKARAWKGTTAYERPRPKAHADMMLHVKGAFELAPSRAERIAALSMVSHLSLSEIQQYIPGLSRYYLNDARKYSKRGYHLVEHKIRRMRYSKEKIDRWLQVVTSYKVTLNSPYGEREVKDSTGTWIQIPNTIRLLRAGEIYRVYKKELSEANELRLLIPESTHRKMLRVVSAERRKSLHGVDIVIADAMEAFDRAGIAIEKMFESKWIGEMRHGTLRSEMLASRQYIRTDFLIHAKEYSSTGDHCWSYGISDPDDPPFQVDCEKPAAPWYHQHSRVCSQCENLNVWLGDMYATIEELLEKHKSNPTILHEIQLLQRDITDWDMKIQKLKGHQLRTAKSENDRQWIVAGLKEADCLLTLDWAMKAMGFNARESTSEWYAQRGMPWHVGNCLTFNDGDFYQHNFIHLFHGTRQDSVAVTAIIRNILEQLAAVQIRRVIIRSDQAGSASYVYCFLIYFEIVTIYVIFIMSADRTLFREIGKY